MATRVSQFRFTEEELSRWDAAAVNEGLNRTAWIRQACDRYAASPPSDVPTRAAREAVDTRHRATLGPRDLAPSPEARQALKSVQSGRTPYKPPYKGN